MGGFVDVDVGVEVEVEAGNDWGRVGRGLWWGCEEEDGGEEGDGFLERVKP